MSTYATVEDFKEYTDIPAEMLPDDDTIQKVLNRAELDVDRYIAGTVDETSGLRVDPESLPVWQLQYLVNATCAQAEYRLIVGEDFFIQGSNDEVIQGPDFTISGTRRRFGIKAAQELRASGLLLMSTRAVP